MTLIFDATIAAPASDSSQGVTVHEQMAILSAMFTQPDSIETRFGLLASLRRGWAGPGSVPPSRAAISTLRRSVSRLEGGRYRIGASPHPDGFINVEWEREGLCYTAHIWADRIETAIDDDINEATVEREFPLDDQLLYEFLRASE